MTRSTIQAPTGIVAQNDATVIDTAIDIGAAGAVALQVQNYSPFPLALHARNVSISGGQAPFSTGIDVESHGTGSATATLTDSVISGPSHPFVRKAVSTGTADLNTAYDDYPAGNYAGTGTGPDHRERPGPHAAPGFAMLPPATFTSGPGHR